MELFEGYSWCRRTLPERMYFQFYSITERIFIIGCQFLHIVTVEIETVGVNVEGLQPNICNFLVQCAYSGLF